MQRGVFDFTHLTVAERLELVEELWDSIAADAGDEVVPLADDVRSMLDERLADLRQHPESGRAWADVRAEILAKRRP